MKDRNKYKDFLVLVYGRYLSVYGCRVGQQPRLHEETWAQGSEMDSPRSQSQWVAEPGFDFLTFGPISFPTM